MRDDQGRFVAGASGNPGGRPRHLTELRDLVEPLLPELVEALFDIATDPTQPARTRVIAIKELLDRGLGRPQRAACAAPQVLPPAEPMLGSPPQPAHAPAVASAPPASPCKSPVLRPGPEPARAAASGKTPVLGSAPEPARPAVSCKAPDLRSSTALGTVLGSVPVAPAKTPVLRPSPV